ncbi:MAG TPA: CpaD family pilus assembly lipoprotein [Geminicoccaceae bacterium]|jgi:pilus biogenesis lipoprotein CpaD|nr:CpaD family pilus assembly lipoprotein [Geminicoccaceae bacterium]
MTAARQHSRDYLRQVPRPLIWLSLLTLSLSACSSSLGPQKNLGWIEASSPKRLEVDRADYRHSVYFATDSSTLTAAERNRLLTFLQTVQPGARDSIRLAGHADERATELYNLELASRRTDQVQAFLEEAGYGGLSVSRAAFGEALPAVPSSGPAAWQLNRRVEVVLERYLVTLPACPDWSRETGTDFDNLPLSNFGCATQANLGLMIAEPKDLVRGRPLAPADGIQQAEGIARYRKGAVVEIEEGGVGN